MPPANTVDTDKILAAIATLQAAFTQQCHTIEEKIMALSPELVGLDTKAQDVLQVVTDLRNKVAAGGSLSIEDKAVLLVVKNAFDAIKALPPV